MVNKEFKELKSEESVEKPSFFYEQTGKERDLLTLEKESSNEIEGGLNETIFVKLEDDGSGIFKPKSGEKPGLCLGIEAGTYFKRERAAYLVDHFLKFNLVPPTVIRDFDGKIGSFQEFIPNAHHPYYVEDMPWTKLKKLWIFDYIIWNSDRHRGNLLLDKKGKNVHAIDNGLSFEHGEFYSYSYRQFWGQAIPNEIKEKLNQFSSSENKKDLLRVLLEELLSKREVGLCFKRIEKVTKVINEKGLIELKDRFDFEGQTNEK